MIKNIASKIGVAIVGLLVAFVMSIPAEAAEGTFTVKQSVAIPNAVLAPGTYTFKQVGTMGAIEVSDINGHSVSMFLTVPAVHQGTSDATEITLKEQRVASIHFASSDMTQQFQYSTKTVSAKNKTQAATCTNGL